MEETKPFVSFIIPVYNLPWELLHNCLKSILALSLRPFEREIIVVDDGSDDFPLSKLTALGEDIIYVRQQNGGLSASRNMGLRVATGRFIQFVDGDDMLLQAPYEHVLDLLRYQPHCDMVLFDFTKGKDPSSHVYDDHGPMAGVELMRKENIHGSACGYVFSRDMLGSLRFTRGIFHEDEEFTPLLLLRAEAVFSTNAQAYLYRQRDSSIMTEPSVRHRLRRLNDARSVIVRLKHKSDTMPPEAYFALQRRIAQLTMDYIYNVIVMTRSMHFLNRQLEYLRRKGLFPLPNTDYTTKYTWFRRMTNSRVGRAILITSLPLMNQEK